MFVRKGLKVSAVLRDSRQVLIVSGVWSFVIVYLHEFLGYEVLVLPQTPVSTIGIVVSLYLGFKSTSAYKRWWEARQIWGDIVNASRTWGNQVLTLIDFDPDEKSKGSKELVHRHVAWVIALAYQLRKVSRLEPMEQDRVFDGRRMGMETFHTANASDYEAFLTGEDTTALEGRVNPATHIIRRQADVVRRYFDAGKLDDHRFVALMGTLERFYDSQGKCERIKNTPFPRQITYFGRIFAWIFIMMLPLAFIDAFEQEAARHNLSGWVEREYVLVLVPFTMLLSLVFFLLEKISESCEDPFEWGTTDVPIAALSRVIEIDVRQMLDEDDVPGPIQPERGVLY